MATRVYVVSKADGTDERLVRATYRHMAERHIAAQLFRSRIASKDDLERLITSGVRVEQAEPAPLDEPESPEA